MEINKLTDFRDEFDSQEIEALQYAALLSDYFSLDYVLDMAHINPAKLFDLIDKLIKNHFIKSKAKSLKGTFVFIQEQFPDLLLTSIGKEKKKLYLTKIIRYLEQKLYKDNKKATILVNLILKFKNDLNDLYYLKKAADLLIADQQTKKALKIYREIIDGLLEKEQDSMENVLFIDSVIAYAPIAINIFPPKDVLPIINNALSISAKLENKRAEAMLELFLGRLYQRQGKSFEASIHCDKGWYLSQKMEDDGLRRYCSNLYALSLFWNGRIVKAIEVYENTLGNIDSISPVLRDFWAYLVLALCYGISGRIGRGVGLAETVLARALSKNNKNIIAASHAIIAVILLDVRRFQEAEIHIDKAIEIGEIIKNDFALYMAKQSKGYLEYKKGNLNKAKTLIETGFDHLEDTTAIHYPSPWFIELLLDFHKYNFESIRGYSFSSEINRLLNWPDIYMKGTALRYYALSKGRNKDNVDEIEELLKESRDLLQEAGAPIELGRTYIELSRYFINKNDLTRASKFAESAYVLFSEIDESLFPPELSFLITHEYTEYNKYRGLNELKTAINYLPDFEKYIGQVVTILANMFGAEHAAILFKLNEISMTFDIIATRNFTPEEIELFKKPELQSLFVKMVEKGPLIIDDPQNKNIHSLSQFNIQVKSLILTPIVVRNNIIGLIYIDNRLLRGIFFKEDNLLMKSISGQLSMAIRYLELSKEYGKFHLDLTEGIQKIDYIENQSAAFPSIIGRSKAITKVLSNVEKMAGTDATVFIYGETGVGKELIAKAIHQFSQRSDKPLIVCNIPALSKNLISAELFGYEKGAFTGAVASKAGRFEIANEGTIFLDEIGDLSLEVQVKLLRVLQDGSFEKVGSNKPIYSDFRVIAATNKDLQQMVERGEFRSDLFYRINTFPIEIYPLRERKEDIPSLALYFLNKYSQKYNKQIKTITPDDMEKLLTYSWPGNVRELEHIIERAVIISSNNNLIIPDLCVSSIESYPPKDSDLKLHSLENIQRLHILKVLKHARGKIRGKTGAATMLGLKPTTLEFRMKKLKIESQSNNR